MPSAPRRFLPALLAVLVAACAPPDEGRPDQVASAYLTIAAAEDARPASGRDLETLRTGTTLEHTLLRQTAVRALGRLENPDLLEEIAHHLDDPVPDVRGQAADAVAQSVHRSDGTRALELLKARLRVEQDPSVIGVIGRSMARLDVNEAARAETIATLLGLTSADGTDAPMGQLAGVVLGIEHLARLGVPFGDRAVGRLSNLGFFDLVEREREPDSGRVRATALSALGHSGTITVQNIEPALRDPSIRVRLAAVGFLDAVAPIARQELIRRSLGDPSAGVRIGTVRQLARETDPYRCDWLQQVAARDESRGVRALALDALAEPCGDPEQQRRTLLGAVSTLGPETLDDWQPAAHALVSLATFDPELARRSLVTFVDHPSPFVRVYGVRAADLLDEVEVVRGGAGDSDANVRTLAIQLLTGRDMEIDELLVTQLSSDDPQLLMTASRLLSGSELGMAAAAASLHAFERISRARRDTWRDPRRALLTRIGELGDRSLVSRLEPYLTDYDPLVAGDVARILRGWTGQAYTPDPRPLPRPSLPGAAELREMESVLVSLRMRRGGEILISPMPYLALTNAYRFVRLAREGYFDGLTFHRWAPNFVIQGGSPGANEYAGDGPYSRDEVGVFPHWRGTVGLSTRGRDTGDAQIFVNLADNLRLDHDYTVFGVVVDGIEVVDEVTEGDVIERAEVRIVN